MGGETVGAILVFAGLLVTQALMHRRWTREQDSKRQALADKLAEERRSEAEEQSRERRAEQADLLSRMAEQNSSVVENALKVAEIHKEDAERARLTAVETAQNHAECRQEVAVLSGKVEELHARITENERTYGAYQKATERHREIKHKALNALTVADGYVSLCKKLATGCTCNAFDPIKALTEEIHPRIQELLAENQDIEPTGVDP